MTVAEGVFVEPEHVPVLAERVVALLAPPLLRPGAVVVDGTLGLGGHAELLLEAAPEVRLVGIDRDPAALARSRTRLAGFGDRVTFVHAVYDALPEVLDELGIPAVQGILLDLGVSSLQLDDDDRGFAYSRDTPLDMRMGRVEGPTAADVLNDYPEREIARVLREYGEEKFARRIAAAVVRERSREPFSTSARLVEVVREAVPAPARRTGGNPAKRTFQALRIEVNDELGALRRVLPAALDALATGGRLAVLSYQSLEDRLVKSAMAERLSTKVPPDLPFVPKELEPGYRRLAWSEPPSEGEIAANPRAASARLRCVERLEVAA
jgi:16S rRNA (cytosine1402-N4)-methyltransferase